MADESTLTGSKDEDPAPQSPFALARAGRAPAAIGAQIGWQFASDGSSQVIDSAVTRSGKRPRDGVSLRSDARRAAEYLATRGKTPLEALHDVAGMRWQTAVRKIARELQCSRLEAFRVWQSCNVALLPYSAARFDTLELGSMAGGGAGGLTVAHFLAASMVAERVASGGLAALSTDGQSVDNGVTEQLPLLAGDSRTDARSLLPPKPAD